MMQNTCRKCGLERVQHGSNKRAKVASHVSESRKVNESNDSTDDDSKEDSEPEDDVKKKNAKKRCIFKPFGEPMLRDDPGTVMCAICGHFKKNHL